MVVERSLTPARKVLRLRVTRCEGQSAAGPQLSPQAAYDQAVRPLEITRRSPQNWSEAELDALKVATGEVGTETALAPGGLVDQLVDWAMAHWPVSTP